MKLLRIIRCLLATSDADSTNKNWTKCKVKKNIRNKIVICLGKEIKILAYMEKWKSQQKKGAMRKKVENWSPLIFN